MFSGTAQVSHQVCQFFVSSVCLLVRVTVLDKNRAVVCCLLATSAIMLPEKKKRKRKMCSKKWYLKRNISCDVDLLNGLLETDVAWDDAIVVWAGKLRKLWDSLSELRSSVCERRLERTVLSSALLPVKTAQFSQLFRQVRRHRVKSLSLTESVWRPSVFPPSGTVTHPFRTIAHPAALPLCCHTPAPSCLLLFSAYLHHWKGKTES